jgi:hypothetical protein
MNGSYLNLPKIENLVNKRSSNNNKWSLIKRKSKTKLLLIILALILSPYLRLIFSKNLKNEKIIIPSKLTDISEVEKKLNLSLEFIQAYSILFDAAHKGLTQGPKYPFRKIERSHRIHKKGVGVCSIGRKENLYAKEFVEYYMKLGIKKIIIYDDNEINGEKFEDVLKDYIANGNVEIIDIHGFESAQFPSYMDCYKKYGDKFDFLLFLDFDEFVKIENDIDINTFIYNKKFKKCQTIVLNWVMYGDNNLVKYDNRTMIQRFTKPISNWGKGKSIVRTNIPNLIISSTFMIGINTQYFCDSNGNRLFPRSYYGFEVPIKPEAYIKHFYTKTAEEFCNKIIKGDGHFHKKHPERLNVINSRIDTFFTFNSITREKLKIIENCSGMNLKTYRKRMKKI